MLCLFCTCRNPGNRTSLQELETHCRLKPKCCVVTKKGLANRNLGGCLICFCLLMLHQRNNFRSLENRGRKCCNNVGICSERFDCWCWGIHRAVLLAIISHGWCKVSTVSRLGPGVWVYIKCLCSFLNPKAHHSLQALVLRPGSQGV